MNNSRFTPVWLRKQERALVKAKGHLLGHSDEVHRSNFADVQPGDEVEAATEIHNRLIALTNLGRSLDTLQSIQDALRRIEKGEYGLCQATGEEISQTRLEAVPWAQYTLSVQEEVDKGKRRPNWNKQEKIEDEKESDEEEAEDEIKV